MTFRTQLSRVTIWPLANGRVGHPLNSRSDVFIFIRSPAGCSVPPPSPLLPAVISQLVSPSQSAAVGLFASAPLAIRPVHHAAARGCCPCSPLWCVSVNSVVCSYLVGSIFFATTSIINSRARSFGL